MMPFEAPEKKTSSEEKQTSGPQTQALSLIKLTLATAALLVVGLVAYGLGRVILAWINRTGNQFVQVLLLWFSVLLLYLGIQGGKALAARISPFFQKKGWFSENNSSQEVETTSPPAMESPSPTAPSPEKPPVAPEPQETNATAKKPTPKKISRRAVSWITRILISVLAVLILLGLLEGGARLYDRINGFPKNFGDLYSAEALPLQGYPFMEDPVYYIERGITSNTKWSEDRTFKFHPDYPGEYFTIENNIRVTPEQPENFQNTIYVFGGSTIFGLQLPNEHTIPSYLQADLREVYGDTYRVVNMGVIAMNSTEQFHLLKTIDLLPGDLVIFYDGVNDAYGLYDYCSDWQIKNGFCPEPPPELSPRMAQLKENYNVFLRNWDDKSRFVFHVLAAHNFPPAHYRDSDKVAELKEGIIAGKRELILQVSAYCDTHGADFIHILQPALFYQTNKTEYEEMIIKFPAASPVGLEKGIILVYQGFEENMLTFDVEGHADYSLTQVLDPSTRPAGEEYYLDWDHVNPRGNEVIAKAILEILSLHLDN